MARTTPNRRVAGTALDREIEEFARQAATAPLVIEPRKEAASVGFNFKMTPTNHARLKRVAEAEDRSLQNLLNTIVWPAIAEKEGEI
jgi:predicted HicB family RNase H-like nuclease